MVTPDGRPRSDAARPSRPSRSSWSTPRARGGQSPSGGSGDDGDDGDDGPDGPLVADCADSLPAFPTGALPERIAVFVREVAVAFQADEGMVGLTCLGMLAACAQGTRFVSIWPGWKCPLGLYVMAVAGPGESKSPVLAAARAPADKVQATRRASARATHTAAIAQAEQEVSHAQGDARAEAQQRLRELRRDPPALPKLFTGDVTPERIGVLMEANAGSIAIIDGEGAGPLGTVAGRYSERANLSPWCGAFDGEPFDVERQTRAAVFVPRPALSIVLMVQPEVLQRFGAVPGAHGQGLLGRFLYSVPSPRAGTCDWSAPPISQGAKREWAAIVDRLLAEEPKPEGRKAIRFTEEAQRRLRAFRQAFEPRRGPTGDLASIVEWASKHCGVLARVAALFALADGADAVSDSHLRRALALSDYFIAHARAALDLARGDAVRTVLRDPVARAIVELVPDGEGLAVTAGELLGLIGDAVPAAMRPSGPRGMASTLERLRGVLARVGIDVVSPKQRGRGRGGRRGYRLTRRPSRSSPRAACENGGGLAPTAPCDGGDGRDDPRGPGTVVP